jgi:hypothetical protein
VNKRDIISGTIFFALAFLVLIYSFTLGLGKFAQPRPGFFPFWSAIFLIIFCLILISENITGKKNKSQTSFFWREIIPRKSFLIVLALLVYALLLPRLGYIPATFFLLLFLFITAGTKIWSALINSLLTVILSYFLFQYLLKTPLPRTLGIL